MMAVQAEGPEVRALIPWKVKYGGTHMKHRVCLECMSIISALVGNREGRTLGTGNHSAAWNLFTVLQSIFSYVPTNEDGCQCCIEKMHKLLLFGLYFSHQNNIWLVSGSITYLLPPGIHSPRWRVSLANQQAPGSVRVPVSKNMVESNWERHPLSASGLQRHAYVCEYTCIWTASMCTHKHVHLQHKHVYTHNYTVLITTVCGKAKHIQKDKSGSICIIWNMSVSYVMS